MYVCAIDVVDCYAKVLSFPALRCKRRFARADPDLHAALAESTGSVRAHSSAIVGEICLNKAQNRLAEVAMVPYMAELWKQFQGTQQLNVAFDASRVGGESTFIFAVWSSTKRLSAWLPDQVNVLVSMAMTIATTTMRMMI